MNEIVLYALNFILNLIEMTVIYLLISCFFSSRFHGTSIIICILALTFLYVISSFLSHSIQMLRIIIFCLLIALWVMVVFREHILKCVAAAILAESFLLFVDEVFIVGFAVISGQSLDALSQSPYAYYIYCYVAKIAELLPITAFRVFMRNKRTYSVLTWRDWMRVVIFPGTSIIIAVLLLRIYAANSQTAYEILLCTMFLVLADFLSIALLNYLEKQQRAMQDYTILRHATKIEQDNVAAWMNAYSNQRKQTHDFQNHLAVIRGLITKEDPDGNAIRYVNKLLQDDLTDSLFSNTGRAVVDAILNQKHSIAQSKGITLRVQLDDLTDFFLPDDALVVVLSNLLDNAIDACEKNTQPDDRMIFLRMKATPEVNFIYIENPTETPVKVIDNHVITTKKSILEHGYGLKNIDAIMALYNAEYALDYQTDTHMFCFSAQIIPQ